MHYTDTAALEKAGRVFNCAKCPTAIKKIRRWVEYKEFTEQDNPSVFPIRINSGGPGYGFCPAKATWDYQAVEYFNKLLLIAILKILPKSGGLDEQDSTLIDDLAWFLPQYEMAQFTRKASSILGAWSPGSGTKKPALKDKRG